MRRSKNTFLNLNPKTYLQLIKQSFLNPTEFIIQTQKSTLKTALLFFSVTTILNWILQQLVHNRDSIIVFSLIPQMLFALPLAVICLFAVSTILYVLAKSLRGKGTFDQSLIATCFASAPLIFAWIPLFRIFSLVWGAILLGRMFQKIHDYSGSKAFLNIALPFLILILLVILLGLVSFVLLFNVDRYLP